jgi:hypothetical protein
MKPHFNFEAIAATQRDFQDLIDRLGTLRPEISEAQNKSEIDDIVTSLVSAVLVREHGINEFEEKFFHDLCLWNKERFSSKRMIVENAKRWASLCRTVPGFLQDAVSFDCRNGTDHSRAILRYIQSMGNLAAIADQNFGLREREVVSDYIAHLERYLDDNQTRAD